MNITVLIPHYRTKELTRYSVNQFLKYHGRHNVRIIVIDNSYPDKSISGLYDIEKDGDITIITKNPDTIQSHGCSFDAAMPQVETEYVICSESDAFPLNKNWLDCYEEQINNGFTWGGSLLRLSGGEFIHPTGAFYKTSLWWEAKVYCDAIEYSYFPNMSRHTNFDCHLMVHGRVLQRFLSHPNEYIELTEGYKDLSIEQMLDKKEFYYPMVGPFHNGMGNLQESLLTYGQRNPQSETPNIILDNKEDFINRIGMEPGQWLSYYLLAKHAKDGILIPTEIKWMRNRGWQQQEYTINEAGFQHIWCGSSFYGMKDTHLNDVYEFKKAQLEKLYEGEVATEKTKVY